MIIIILPPTHTLKTHLHHVEYEQKKEKKVEVSFLGGMRGGVGGFRSEPTSKNGAAK